MSSLDLPCPQCGTVLKLPDRGLLGRKGKCKKCQHKFLLVEPEPAPVKLEMAGASQPPLNVDETMVGEFVKWVPDTSREGLSAPTPVPAPRRSGSRPAPAPVVPEALFTPQPEPIAGSGLLPGVDDALPPVTTLTRRKKRNHSGLIVGGVVALVVVAAGAAAWLGGLFEAQNPPKPVARKSHGVSLAKRGSARVTSTPDEQEERASLDLTLLPDGVEVLVHLRPSELWADVKQAKEFRYALGPLATWLEDEKNPKAGLIRRLTFQDPRNIEELLIGLIPQIHPTPPDVCFVVRTTRNVKPSDLIAAFDGTLEQVGARQAVYVGDTWAYYIKDPKTYAGCPVALKSNLLENIDRPMLPRDELRPVVASTDRARQVTIVALNDMLYQHVDTMLPPDLHKATTAVLDWFTSDVKAFAWSLHLDESELDSEFLLGVDATRSASRVKATFEQALQVTPETILDLVQQTHPDTVGRQKLVGRFPAMIKAYALATSLESEKGVVRMRTFLPERAAPNLAAAGMFTWRLTTLPSFGLEHAEPTEPTQPETQLTIAERLQKKIPEVDFRDDMMYVCFKFIEDDIGVTFKLEGDDLMKAGVTQNIKQKFKMENAPATVVIDKIVTPLKLCIVVDEAKQLVHVTSLAAAEQRGWKPFPLK